MAFTRSWEESHPEDTEDASLGDDRIRNLKTDIGERLVDLSYGFNTEDITGDEDTSGVKKINLKEQSSDPTVATDQITIYAKNVDGNNEIFAKDEAGNVKQLTSGGTLKVVAGDYAADSIDENDIQLANNAYLTAKNAAGTDTVNLIKAGANNLPTLPDSAEMASGAAPVENEAIPNKKYVDDQVGKAQMKADNVTGATFGAGSESCTMANGMIIKGGIKTASTGDTTVTFGNAFPGGILTAVVCFGMAVVDEYNSPSAKTLAAGSFVIDIPEPTITNQPVNWIAIGY